MVQEYGDISFVFGGAIVNQAVAGVILAKTLEHHKAVSLVNQQGLWDYP